MLVLEDPYPIPFPVRIIYRGRWTPIRKVHRTGRKAEEVAQVIFRDIPEVASEISPHMLPHVFVKKNVSEEVIASENLVTAYGVYDLVG